MLSISISVLLFALWLLRILIFPGMYLESHFFCPVFDVAQHFLKPLLCRSKQEHIVSKAQIREAIVIAISWAKCHSFFHLPAWKVVFQGHLQDRVEEQAGWRVDLLGRLFFDLEHVTLLVRHYSSFSVFVESFQEVDVFMFDTTGFEGVPYGVVGDGIKPLHEVNRRRGFCETVTSEAA